MTRELRRARNEIRVLSRTPSDARDWSHVGAAMVDLAEELGQSHGRPPPTDLAPILRIVGINTIRAFARTGEIEAALVPTSDGLVIRIAPGGYDRKRNRASIAHEAGHALFYDTSFTPPARVLEGSRSGCDSAEEERLCWRFARHLLMPLEPVRDLLTTRGVSPASMWHVAETFEVSLELSMIHLLHDGDIFERAMGFVRTGPPGREPSVRGYKTKSLRSRRIHERRLIDSIRAALATVSPEGALEELQPEVERVGDMEFRSAGSTLGVAITFRPDAVNIERRQRPPALKTRRKAGPHPSLWREGT